MKLKRVKFNRFVEVEPKPAPAVQAVTNVDYDLEYDRTARCVSITSKATGRVVMVDLTDCEWEPEARFVDLAVYSSKTAEGPGLSAGLVPADIGAPVDEPKPARGSARRPRKGKPQ